jgi:muramoyltetrapeptide carboxypeptidase
MVTPGYLCKGDRIALVAPAGRIQKETVEAAVKTLIKWGLDVSPGRSLYNDHFQYSACDDDRLSDLQLALDDPEIKALLCVRGGYGTIRIIDRINFGRFRKKPKWIIGFSDITALHSHIHTRFGIETIHGSMAAGIDGESPSAETLRTALFGEPLHYTLENHSLSITGSARGQITGGNLAVLAGLLGSASDIKTRGKILFLEEVGEHLYRIDRMMWSLKRAGKLDHISGLMVGSITGIPDLPSDFGKEANEIILSHISGYDYPVCFGFPAGHQSDNRALILGRQVSMDIGSKTVIEF